MGVMGRWLVRAWLMCSSRLRRSWAAAEPSSVDIVSIIDSRPELRDPSSTRIKCEWCGSRWRDDDAGSIGEFKPGGAASIGDVKPALIFAGVPSRAAATSALRTSLAHADHCGQPMHGAASPDAHSPVPKSRLTPELRPVVITHPSVWLMAALRPRVST
jgi:hypothetical protein